MPGQLLEKIRHTKNSATGMPSVFLGFSVDIISEGSIAKVEDANRIAERIDEYFFCDDKFLKACKQKPICT